MVDEGEEPSEPDGAGAPELVSEVEVVNPLEVGLERLEVLEDYDPEGRKFFRPPLMP